MRARGNRLTRHVVGCAGGSLEATVSGVRFPSPMAPRSCSTIFAGRKGVGKARVSLLYHAEVYAPVSKVCAGSERTQQEGVLSPQRGEVGIIIKVGSLRSDTATVRHACFRRAVGLGPRRSMHLRSGYPCAVLVAVQVTIRDHRISVFSHGAYWRIMCSTDSHCTNCLVSHC